MSDDHKATEPKFGPRVITGRELHLPARGGPFVLGGFARYYRNGRLPMLKLSWTEARLAEGLRRYRAEDFFAAHEFWESVWLEAQEPEKTFLQALIQVTAAFHHFRRENLPGTSALLTAAHGRLERYPQIFACVDVESLRGEIRTWLEALDGNALPLLAFPAIHVTAADEPR